MRNSPFSRTLLSTTGRLSRSTLKSAKRSGLNSPARSKPGSPIFRVLKDKLGQSGLVTHLSPLKLRLGSDKQLLNEYTDSPFNLTDPAIAEMIRGIRVDDKLNKSSLSGTGITTPNQTI